MTTSHLIHLLQTIEALADQTDMEVTPEILQEPVAALYVATNVDETHVSDEVLLSMSQKMRCSMLESFAFVWLEVIEKYRKTHPATGRRSDQSERDE